MALFSRPTSLPSPEQALPGRTTPMPRPEAHAVTGHPLCPPLPEGMQQALFGMGCFWGVERLFWQQPGVWTTLAAYAGGHTPNPTYEEVCSGQTGHTEVVWVVFDPQVVDYLSLLKVFWERHDPTQGMRQGNDQGTQYRSAIYCFDEAQLAQAEQSRAIFQTQLDKAGRGLITSEIRLAPTFYAAEAYHQQYLAKHPEGYCGLRGTGVCLPL